VAIDNREWNTVRSVLGASDAQLFERVEREITDETGEVKTVASFEPVAGGSKAAQAAFAIIEGEVERMVQEINSLYVAERELRVALEDGALDGRGGAEMHRR
jgi:hypothetical protein